MPYVIACFRPKPGKEDELLAVVRDHMPVLRRHDLITDRPCHVMRAADGCIIEVFEWKSPQAIEAAHNNDDVRALWKRYEACCEYIPLKALPNAGDYFPGFEAVEL